MASWLDAQRPWLDRARARWAPRRVEPLHLRVWLAAPVAYDGRDPITLEGALQAVVVQREAGAPPDDVFALCPHGVRVDVPVPIADTTIAGRPIACASIGWPAPYPAHAEGMRWRRKRPDAEAYRLDKLMVNGGWGKTLNIPVATLTTPWLDVYVRGDRDLLVELVADTAFGGLGRDATRGLGTVLGVEVRPDPDDRSLLHRGAPQRALPLVQDGGPYDARSFAPDTWEERVCPTRAPYWIQADAVRCAVPVVRLGMPAEAA